MAAFRQASADMTQKVESEGIVMLENKNQTLPLASGSKINLFGYGSRDTVYGGSGSGSGDSSNNITLEQGLTNAGFSVNPELVSFYNDHFVERTGVGFTGNNFDINEPAVNEYSDEMIANAKAYSDVAVFVVSRLGGEGADLPMDMDPNAEGELRHGSCSGQLHKCHGTRFPRGRGRGCGTLDWMPGFYRCKCCR